MSRSESKQEIESLPELMARIRSCRLCAEVLPLGPKPVLAAGAAARILIVGQAPGKKAHTLNRPWDDPSGDRLREWLQVSRDQFYDPDLFALVPMGFCFPGTGRGGDLPPRPECAATWHAQLFPKLPEIGLRLYIGRYAIARYASSLQGPLQVALREQSSLGPLAMALPHPSPRNQLWLRRNPWFATELLPGLQERVRALIP